MQYSLAYMKKKKNRMNKSRIEAILFHEFVNHVRERERERQQQTGECLEKSFIPVIYGGDRPSVEKMNTGKGRGCNQATRG